MGTIGHVQIGKNGITENFIGTLQSHFKKHDNMKISVLKGAGHEKEKVKGYCEKILNSLGRNYTARVVGFTIFVKKWRKPVR